MSRRKFTSKKTIRSKIEYIWERYIKRYLIVGGALLLAIWFGSWLWLGGYVKQAGDYVRESFFSVTEDAGLSVTDVMIEGRVNTDLAAIKAIINIVPGDPLLSFNPETAKEQIEKISWVKTARVERRLPDTIYIQLQERKPEALWYDDRKTKLIDIEGVVLTSKKAGSYGDFITLVGDKAPDNFQELFVLIRAEDQIEDRIRRAVFVKDRRWDLVLDNDVVVSLPEKDIALAISTLAKAQRDEDLLARDVKRIDLRQPGRIILQTDRGKVEDLIPLIN